MSWAIRRMAAADIYAVLALEERTPEAPHWNRLEYERCLGSSDSGSLVRAAFVADADGEVVGFSVGKLVAGVCELESMAVDCEARGRGIGAALVTAVTDWARANGGDRIELEVRASNARAISLYERAGLCREGLRTGYYHSPDEDAVLMGASLWSGGKLA
jgi:[ribosomal protein S18]-alanine N-acetyltransferase